MAWWRRIFRFRLRKRRAETESGELPEHVELWIRELIDDGLEPQAAREEALRSFGLAERIVPVQDPAGERSPVIRRFA